MREVSRAVGRPIDGVEAQAIEQQVLRALREEAQDRARWSAASPAERVQAAGARAAERVLSAALARRSRVGGRRFAQAQPLASWIAERVPQTEIDSLKALVSDARATPDEILAHPALAAIEAAAPGTTTIARPDPALLAGRRYRIDGKEFDAHGYVAHMRARAEAETPAPLRRERQAVIVTGQPGAGKSTTRRALARMFGAASIDLDVMREGIPEFAGGRGSGQATQAEAGALRDLLTLALLRDGQNVLYENVGHNVGAVRELAASFRAAGYRVMLANVSVSYANSVRRYALRTLSEGRFVEAGFIARVGDSPRTVYQALVDEGGFDGYIQVDGDGPQGQERIAHAASVDAAAFEHALAAGRPPGSAGPAGSGPDGGGGDAAGRGGAAGGEGGETLGQRGGGAGALRGETFIPEGGVFADPGVIVSLFETADRSTPFHELGHVYLELFKAYAAREEAPAQLLADWDAVKAWLGWDGLGDIPEAAHEQFARGLERYAAEGKAPSPGLESFFAAFQRWFAAIYRTLLDLDVELPPEVRAVFDRLLKDPDDALPAEPADLARRDRDLFRDGGDGARHDRPDRGAGDRRSGAGRGAAAGSEPRRGGAEPDRPAAAPSRDVGTLITPAMTARDPELKAIAGELVEARAEIAALERQGRIAPAEANAARADLERMEKAAARPELLRAAALCLQHGARVNPGGA
ncbi:MAG: hypothetical protein BroJett013_30590 [Alphaproteobacteria bacterium]|nr:MAG: hypothetical protein BroJett013_30590 [Alphaproteobacteria bacterium]